MSYPPVVSRQEWLTARKSLLAQEKQLTHARDKLNSDRRRLPMVKVDKKYVFDGPNGKATLLDLFEQRRQLIVYHMMLTHCPGCSLLIDNIGHLAHLHARDTTLVVVSKSPFAELDDFRSRMGWTVPFYSSTPPTSTTTSTPQWTHPSRPSKSTTPARKNYRRQALITKVKSPASAYSCATARTYSTPTPPTSAARTCSTARWSTST